MWAPASRDESSAGGHVGPPLHRDRRFASTATPATRDLARTVGLGALVVAVAAAVRLVGVGDLPYGLHGDEALTGLDAQRVLEEGWIGPYVYPSGLGQPAGPLYWVAFVFAQLGPSMTTLRGAIAIFGIATVALTYVLAATWFGRATGAIAAFLLAVMPWHFHLSRTGYMVASWPVAVLATCWLLTVAVRPAARVAWALAAGLVAGLGVYTYNAYPIAFLLYGAALGFAALRDRALAPTAVRAAWFAAGALITASVMILWALEHPEAYLVRPSGLMLFTSEEWLAAPDWLARVQLFLGEIEKYVVGLTLGGRPDFADGLSSPGFPPLDPIVAVAAVIGCVMAWRRFDRFAFDEHAWACGMLCAAALIFPWGALLTVGNGDFRRTLALAPFVAMLAALPFAALWRTRDYRWTALLGATLALSAAIDVLRYPASMRTPEAEHVFAPELRQVAEYVTALPQDTQVNFYSDRWSIHYETLRFLAGDLDARDRSREFREDDVTAWDDITPPAAFIFVGRYVPWARRAETRWPGGHSVEFVRGDRVRWRAYLID